LEQLDTARQPLYADCSKLLANLKELSRQVPIVQNLMETICQKLAEGESKSGERSPTPETVECVLDILMQVKTDLENVDSRMGLLRGFASCDELEEPIVSFRERFESLWGRRREMLCQQLNAANTLVHIYLKCTRDNKNAHSYTVVYLYLDDLLYLLRRE